MPYLLKKSYLHVVLYEEHFNVFQENCIGQESSKQLPEKK